MDTSRTAPLATNISRFTLLSTENTYCSGLPERERTFYMTRKTVKFNRVGASKLPVDKPVVYKIQTGSGKTNYVGIAKRGRAQERIQEHLDSDKIPGSKVQIEQMASIQDAQKKEQAIISRTKPKYNEQGK
jgi:hypothetical protein